MIRALLNLRCRVGHRHYAPEPDKWVGRTCMYPTEKGVDQRSRKCQEPMSKIKEVK